MARFVAGLPNSAHLVRNNFIHWIHHRSVKILGLVSKV